jgi:hypothetical protein
MEKYVNLHNQNKIHSSREINEWEMRFKRAEFREQTRPIITRK